MSGSSSREGIREYLFTRKDFNFLRKIANDHSGIVISEDKFNMLYSRLSRRVRTLGLRSFGEYCDYIRNRGTNEEILELVNAITTNMTAFFRENHHFEYLSKEVVPELLRRNSGSRKVRIWSAGCSTGEEPYSISIVLQESLSGAIGWDTRIFASDVDSNALMHASRGIYSEEQVSGIDESRLRRWFLKGKGEQEGMVRLKPGVRDLVGFGQLNLMKNWKMPEPMDVIFCRNVIIYFSKPAKITLVERFANTLKEGGYLFMGHSETLFRLTDRFETVGNTIYRKKG